MRIKVSVIIPIYNVEHFLPRCLDSILAQTMSSDEFEVILVDDGSSDESGTICDEYSEKHHVFKVIHQENAGAAAARNAGLSVALGDYVSFVDPDDYVEPDYLKMPYERAVETESDVVIFDAKKEIIIASNNHKTIDLVHASMNCSTSYIDDIASLRCQILYPYMSAHMGDVTFASDVPLAAPWDKLYKRSFLEENGLCFPKDLKVLDDMCFNFVVFGKATKISYLHHSLYHYVVNKSSITNSYKADRPAQDMKVFRFLQKELNAIFPNEEVLGDMCDDYDLLQAYYARIIKSFAICCRLYFFNPENPGTFMARLVTVKQYMEMEPYRTAFLQCDKNVLEWKLNIVAFAGKLKDPKLMLLLHRFQNGN